MLLFFSKPDILLKRLTVERIIKEPIGNEIGAKKSNPTIGIMKSYFNFLVIRRKPLNT